jgi:GNAT superfamily N-acetyltransferase
MYDPRKTGISAITGKMVVIRHATETDRVRVEQFLLANEGNADIEQADVVVAAEQERIIGFGILTKGDGAGCVSLFEDSRRKGIATAITNHLEQFAPTEKLYVSRIVSYFTRKGFRERLVHSKRHRRSAAGCSMPLLEPLSAGSPA